MLIYAKYNKTDGLLWYVLNTADGSDLAGGFDQYDGAQRWVDRQEGALPGTNLAIVHQKDGTWSVLSTKTSFEQRGFREYKTACVYVKVLMQAALYKNSFTYGIARATV